MSLDLNLDAGEEREALFDGREERLYRMVTRINIACGGHAGDDETMGRAVELGAKAGLAVGAHPSYPDRAHFGRRALNLPIAELQESVRQQLRALKRVAQSQGVRLSHIKPHGALYNQIAADGRLAEAFAETVVPECPGAALVGLAGSMGNAVWRRLGVHVLAEAFADRAYLADGSLVPRSTAGAVITDPERAADQAERLLRSREVIAISGERIGMPCDTLCIHGDNPAAESLLVAIRARFTPSGDGKSGTT